MDRVWTGSGLCTSGLGHGLPGRTVGQRVKSGRVMSDYIFFLFFFVSKPQPLPLPWWSPYQSSGQPPMTPRFCRKLLLTVPVSDLVSFLPKTVSKPPKLTLPEPRSCFRSDGFYRLCFIDKPTEPKSIGAS
ncbi:hypothetical protein COLO4_20584 [Corchorus olitorius]|uniref:Uncharacterized protein n=1 Tax=Corchorus olitorius TaxID=93759 RepID=A0A1R3IYW3_9ROSI|nr:hypothetical protein COLO4_20584 [Corchorus olitorius]